jgi:hypothetical protein
MRQLLAIAGTLSAISGAGGAITVKAQDAVQDERLEQHEREIGELRAEVAKISGVTTETAATVKGLEADVSTIAGDTKAIRSLLDQLLGREQSRARAR